MPSLADLMVKVGIDAGPLTRGLTDINQNFRDLNKELGAMERALAPFDKIGERMTSAGTALSLGITAPLGLATAAVTTLSGSFDLEMAKVNSLMKGVTDGEMKRLHDGVLDLSMRMGIDAVGGANALYEAISAGVPRENVIDFLGTASQAAIAGVTDTKVAVDGLTSVLNAYQLPASEAKNISDQMFQAVNVGKFTFDQLASSISIATPLAAQLGVDFGTVAATAATLTSQGFSVSEAMTSIRGAMVALISPNKDMNALIAATGYESGQALIKAHGFQGALGLIREKAEGNVTVLTNAFGRVEALGAALGVTGENAVTAAGHLDTVTHSAGATQQAFDKITGTNAQQWDMLKNRVEAVAIEFGVALAPAITLVLNAAVPLVQHASDLVKWFTELPAPVQGFALALGAVAAAAGPVLIVVGSLISSVSTIIPLIASFGGATAGAGAGAVTLSGALAGMAAIVPPLSVAVLGLATAWAAWKFQDSIPGLILLKDIIGFLHAEYSTLFSVISGGISVLTGTKQPTIDVTKALGDMNAKAKPLHEQMGVVIQKSKDLNKEFPKLKTNTANLATKTKDLKDETHNLTQKNGPLYVAMKLLTDEYNAAKTAVDNYKAKVILGRTETVDFTRVMEDLEEIVGETDSSIGNLASVTLPDFLQATVDSIKPPNDLKAALKQLGITGSADLQLIASEAVKARDIVLGSNLATDFEKKTAVYKALKAQVDAAVQAGIDVPAEQKAMLEKMETELNVGKGKDVVTASSGMFTQVSTIITNFAQDAAKILFDGDLSWGEKAKKMWTSLQQALMSTFIEPATKALTEFMTGVLQDLISGKGFGGVLGQISKIGSELKDVFGAGGVAAPTPTPTTSPGGGAGGAAGGAAASGVTALVTAISSVATAVSSIIGNFQMMGMNKSLDLIEHEVRFSQIHLKELVERAQNTFLAELPNIRALSAQFVDNHAWRIHDVWDQLGSLNNLIANTTNVYLDRIATAVEVPAMAAAAGGGVTVNIYSPNFTNQAGVDDAIGQIKRNLR